jgi:glutathione S-transferase
MTLRLHYHPLSSFCWKVLIALYEKGLEFDPVIVNLGDPEVREAFRKISPMAKMPALEDTGRGEAVFETSAIIDYLDLHHPGVVRLVPADPDQAWRARRLDRVFDLYVNEAMGKVVTDKLRPEGANDAFGVEAARGQLRAAYAWLEGELKGRTWAMGEAFTLADCAAAPGLFYADKIEPFAASHPMLGGYLERLKARPSFARVLQEAEPFFHMFPG